MSHLTEIIRFNEEENKKNDIIYQLLKKELIESLNLYNLGDNIFGVYFVHLIKFLTGSQIRQNELKEKLVLAVAINATTGRTTKITPNKKMTILTFK